MSKDAPEKLRQSGSNSIPDDAFVLRRVPNNYVDTTLPLPILPPAFRPTPDDTDGLSVNLDERHGGTTPSALATAGRGGADRYVVVALRVGDLRNIGLSVIAKDIPDGLPGHAVIPELNVTDYQASKQSKRVQKVLQMKLCALASQAIIYPPDYYSGVSH